MDFTSLAVFVALVFTAVSSYYDFKTREVENYITVGLIATAVILQGAYAFLTGEWHLFVYAIGFGALFFGFGWLMFQTGQWGGADVKILTGLAVLFANFEAVAPWPFMLTFFLNVFVVGFVYTILYGVYLTYRDRSVISDFKKRIEGEAKELYLLVGVTILGVGVAGIFVHSIFTDWVLTLIVIRPLLVLIALIPIFWGILKYARSLENKTLRIKTKAKDLREFDLLTEDILREGRKIVRIPEEKTSAKRRREATEVLVNCKDPNGLTIEQIKKIAYLVRQKRLKDSFVVKWGLPFVPVFLIAIVVTLLFGDLLCTLI